MGEGRGRVAIALVHGTLLQWLCECEFKDTGYDICIYAEAGYSYVSFRARWWARNIRHVKTVNIITTMSRIVNVSCVARFSDTLRSWAIAYYA